MNLCRPVRRARYGQFRFNAIKFNVVLGGGSGTLRSRDLAVKGPGGLDPGYLPFLQALTPPSHHSRVNSWQEKRK